MSVAPSTPQKIPYTFRLAQFTTLCFGMAMTIWGLTPAIIHRMVSGEGASLRTWSVSSLTIFVGLALLGLGALVGSGTRWALWTTLSLAGALLLGSLAMAYWADAGTPNIFAIVMPGATAATAWLALDTCRRRDRSAPPPAQD